METPTTGPAKKEMTAADKARIQNRMMDMFGDTPEPVAQKKEEEPLPEVEIYKPAVEEPAKIETLKPAVEVVKTDVKPVEIKEMKKDMAPSSSKDEKVENKVEIAQVKPMTPANTSAQKQAMEEPEAKKTETLEPSAVKTEVPKGETIKVPEPTTEAKSIESKWQALEMEAEKIEAKNENSTENEVKKMEAKVEAKDVEKEDEQKAIDELFDDVDGGVKEENAVHKANTEPLGKQQEQNHEEKPEQKEQKRHPSEILSRQPTPSPTPSKKRERAVAEEEKKNKFQVPNFFQPIPKNKKSHVPQVIIPSNIVHKPKRQKLNPLERKRQQMEKKPSAGKPSGSVQIEQDEIGSHPPPPPAKRSRKKNLIHSDNVEVQSVQGNTSIAKFFEDKLEKPNQKRNQQQSSYPSYSSSSSSQPRRMEFTSGKNKPASMAGRQLSYNDYIRLQDYRKRIAAGEKLGPIDLSSLEEVPNEDKKVKPLTDAQLKEKHRARKRKTKLLKRQREKEEREKAQKEQEEAERRAKQ